METGFSALDALLLERQQVLCVAPGSHQLDEAVMQGLDINLAQMGFALSTQLAQRVRSLSPEALATLWQQVLPVLLAKTGAGQKHVPLLRHFPFDIPADTEKLWQKRVLAHYCQAQHQACLFCHRQGCTQVLSPCHHVVCQHCFDGSNYSACPVCGHQVDAGSRFFLPAPLLHDLPPAIPVRENLALQGQTVYRRVPVASLLAHTSIWRRTRNTGRA